MAIRTVGELNQYRTGLPALVEFEVVSVEADRLSARMPIKPELLAANGYLHAASVIALADSACGFGTIADLGDEYSGFTTIELKSNFLATALEGTLSCEAVRQHRGRTTQVWDATVRSDSSGKTIALFRCTQILLAR